MIFSTDIDIDFRDRADACAAVPHIPASMWQKGELVRHPSGVYFQDIPIQPFVGCAALPYGEAEKYGYFKIDFLSNSVYEGVRDKAHLKDLLNREVPWEFFMEPSVVKKLSHIHNHFGIVKQIKPTSVMDLAVILALMRPAKKHLCFKPREEIDREIWVNNDGGYLYKKSHATAYAVSIVIQLQLLIEQIGNEIDGEDDNVFAL